MQHVRRRDLPSFVRLEITDGDQRCEIDLAVDYRALELQASRYGPTLALEELAANKVLAVFDRAEPRDFRDLAAVTERFSFERLCELASEKDVGFDLGYLRQALRSFDRFTQEDLGVGEREYRDLAAHVQGWIACVERLAQPEKRVGPDDPDPGR